MTGRYWNLQRTTYENGSVDLSKYIKPKWSGGSAGAGLGGAVSLRNIGKSGISREVVTWVPSWCGKWCRSWCGGFCY